MWARIGSHLPSQKRERPEREILMEFENTYRIRKHATTKWEELKTSFGLFGLFSELNAAFKMPSGRDLFYMEVRLEMGGSITIGDYEVKLARK